MGIKRIGLMIAALLAVGTAVPVEAADRPNIVVIISDDQGYHDYGFLGHPVIRTPHLDRLASESLVFERGYVTTALCAPSLASMQTGLYPHQHGWSGNDPAKARGGWGKRQEWIDRYAQHPQLAALLSDAGYLTLHTGKYWQGDPETISGFTHSMGATQRHGSKESLGVGRDGMQTIYDFIGEAQEQDKPFMVWYAPFLPHTPHTPPQRLLDKYKGKAPDVRVAKYYAMVEWLDETCGELMQHLDDNGLRDNTIVLYVCDNGWSQGAPGYRGSKQTPWEQGVRTPIMVRWPGKVQPRRDRKNVASNLDIPATALSAAGLPVPEGMQGINLLENARVQSRKTIFIEDFAHDMEDPQKPEKTLEARGVIHNWWKLVVTYADDKKGGRELEHMFLFHLEQDPKETTNLADQYPGTVASLLLLLNEWWNPELAVHGGDPVKKYVRYRTVGMTDLSMGIWYPPGREAGGEKLPAMVLFFGGGWHDGSITQWKDLAPALARRGMIVIAPEYRTGRQGVMPDTCLKDAKTAMRYIYNHADALGVDRERISAGGRSAGGHLAAATAFSRGFNTEGDDTGVPTAAGALVLFNPVIDNGPGGFRHAAVQDYWKDFSPLHTITTNPPPTLFLTGDRDQYTPIETAHKYKVAMEAKGGQCKLVIFEGGRHGSPFSAAFFEQSVQEIDDFLVNLGHIAPK